MRRCRKMISVIMLMVMLVTQLPSGALAVEAPTGGDKLPQRSDRRTTRNKAKELFFACPRVI